MTLNDFFCENTRVALAFSGGVDSSYLLYAALASGAQVRAYYVKSAFQPQFELEDALRLVKQLNADLKIIPVDVLTQSNVVVNPKNRCYFCKKCIFSTIAATAAADGFSVLIDGTNASDDTNDRPGMRALQELHVRSPLREAGLAKPKIRALSREAGLFTWDKPAYACLATRIPTGEVITAEKLNHIERAEQFLFSLGLTDFRVRLFGGTARIQAPAGQLALILASRAAITAELGQYCSGILLDLEARDEH